jgi:hypothetical protein
MGGTNRIATKIAQRAAGGPESALTIEDFRPIYVHNIVLSNGSGGVLAMTGEDSDGNLYFSDLIPNAQNRVIDVPFYASRGLEINSSPGGEAPVVVFYTPADVPNPGDFATETQFQASMATAMTIKDGVGIRVFGMLFTNSHGSTAATVTIVRNSTGATIQVIQVPAVTRFIMEIPYVEHGGIKINAVPTIGASVSASVFFSPTG